MKTDVPGFTADASLYKSTASYYTSGATGGARASFAREDAANVIPVMTRASARTARMNPCIESCIACGLGHVLACDACIFCELGYLT
jgi:hypothetical protein